MLQVQMVWQVQTWSQVHVVPTTVRVCSVFDSPPVLTAPTVMVLHTQVAPAGSAVPAGSQIVLQVHTMSQVHTVVAMTRSCWLYPLSFV